MEQTKNITVIPARRRVGNISKESEIPKLRVAAYCRVSTDSDEQATSYEAQVEHYTDYIRKNPEWELAGIFADDRISGTNTKKREEFNRMIDEAMAGRMDLVMTMSILPAIHSSIIRLNSFRFLVLVPEIPSSANMPASSHSGFF